MSISMDLEIHTQMKKINTDAARKSLTSFDQSVRKEANNALAYHSKAWSKSFKSVEISAYKALKNIATYLVYPVVGLKDLIELTNELGFGFDKLIDQQDQYRQLVYNTAGGMDEITESIARMSAQTGISNDKISDSLKALVDQGLQLNRTGEEFEELVKLNARFVHTTGAASGTVAEFEKRMIAVGGSVEQVTDSIRNMENASYALGLTGNDLNQIMSTTSNSALNLRARFGVDEIMRFNNEMIRMAASAKNIGAPLSDVVDISNKLVNSSMDLIVALGSDALFKTPAENAKLLAARSGEILDHVLSFPPGLQNELARDIYGVSVQQLEVLKNQDKINKAFEYYEDTGKLIGGLELDVMWKKATNSFKEFGSLFTTRFENIKRTVVAPLLEVVTGIIEKIRGPLSSLFDTIGGDIRGFIDDLSAGFDGLSKDFKLIDFLANSFVKSIELAKSIWIAISDYTLRNKKFIDYIVIGTKLFVNASKKINDFIMKISDDMMKYVVAIGIKLYSYVEIIGQKLKDVYGVIEEHFNSYDSSFKALIEGFKIVFGAALEFGREFAINFLIWAGDTFKGIYDVAGKEFEEMAKIAEEKLGEAFSKLGTILKNALIDGFWGYVKEAGKWAQNPTGEAAKLAFDMWKEKKEKVNFEGNFVNYSKEQGLVGLSPDEARAKMEKDTAKESGGVAKTGISLVDSWIASLKNTDVKREFGSIVDDAAKRLEDSANEWEKSKAKRDEKIMKATQQTAKNTSDALAEDNGGFMGFDKFVEVMGLQGKDAGLLEEAYRRFLMDNLDNTNFTPEQMAKAAAEFESRTGKSIDLSWMNNLITDAAAALQPSAKKTVQSEEVPPAPMIDKQLIAQTPGAAEDNRTNNKKVAELLEEIRDLQRNLPKMVDLLDREDMIMRHSRF